MWEVWIGGVALSDSVPGDGSSSITVRPNSSSLGKVDSGGDSDWYRVSLAAGVQYQFDLVGSAGDGADMGLKLANPLLILRDGSGREIRTDDDGGLGDNARILWTPSASGTYFLEARSSSVLGVGEYALIVNQSPWTGTVSSGQSISGSLLFAGDVNVYGVSLVAGKTYTVRLEGNTLTNPWLELVDVAGKHLDADDDSGPGLSSLLQVTPESSGNAFLSVRASGWSGIGSYTLSVVELVRPPTVSLGAPEISFREADTGTGEIVFPVTLSAPVAYEVTVQYATLEQLSTASEADYVPVSGELKFTPGQTKASIRVVVKNDDVFEPDEHINVSIGRPIGAVLKAGETNVNGFIRDDDAPYSLPSDLLVRLQWYLYPGAGINTFTVWPEYTGRGVRIAIFDQGIDQNHPDLNNNLAISLGRNATNLQSGGAPVRLSDTHGTMVAGILAAERDGAGIVGVAYNASLVSIYSPLQLAGMPRDIVNAYRYAMSVSADIINDSWGFASGFSSGLTWAFYDNFNRPPFAESGAALKDLAYFGRNGLGTIVVQSAGNSFLQGDDTNLHNFQNSSFIITVAATDYRGKVTSYSSPGASVLIAAPGGGGNQYLGDVLTTTKVGSGKLLGGYYELTSGTSFSAPLVSGIAALMLEANPRLGYRDVQEILANTARLVSADDHAWAYNGAGHWNGGGMHFDSDSHNLGFGLVDAHAAVRLAETWTKTSTASNREQVSATRLFPVSIPDNSMRGAVDVVTIEQDICVERVEIALKVAHSSIGDLRISLMSPSGTTSVLMSRPQQTALNAVGSSRDNIDFTFSTVLSWGERSVGQWSLALFDNAPGETGSLQSWTIHLLGQKAGDDSLYVFTDEYAESRALAPSRGFLSDSGGIDTLNFSAMSLASLIDLGSGTTSAVDGAPFQIANGTVIENIIGGDGNDQFIGNEVDNLLRGMRGDDTLIGGAGNDTLEGGAGDDLLVGGAGRDTAILRGNRNDYSISHTGRESLRIVDQRPLSEVTASSRGDGVDALQSVERLKFADYSIAFDDQGASGQAFRLYRAAFDREPDLPGLGFWIRNLDTNWTLQSVANAFIDSPEFSSLYGRQPSDTAFIDLLYRNVLDRAPEPSGFENWQTALSGGMSRADVLVGFSESAENNANVIHLLVNGIRYVEWAG